MNGRMKRIMDKLLSWTVICVMAWLAVGCHSERLTFDYEEQGQLVFTDFTFALEETDGRLTMPTDKANYRLTLSTTEGKLLNEWKVDELPASIGLPEGTYQLKMWKSGLKAGLNQPYYEGTQRIAIRRGEQTEVKQMICKFASLRFAIRLTDDLRRKVGNDLQFRLELGSEVVQMTAAEMGQTVYFALENPVPPAILHFAGSVDGKFYTFEQLFDVKAKTEVIVLELDLETTVANGNAAGGDLKISIKIDDTMTVVPDLIVVNPGEEPPMDDAPDTEQPPHPDAPQIIGTNFKGSSFAMDGAPLELRIAEVSPGNNVPLVVTLKAPLKMAHVFVTIDSELLNEQLLNDIGLGRSFDLATPRDAAQQEVMKGLGLPVKEAITGQTEVLFDLTGFTGLMGGLGQGTHRFIIRVVDESGNETEKTLTIRCIE